MTAKLKILKETHRVVAVRLRPTTIDYRGNSATIRPTITSRAVKPPLPRGHRTYLEVSK